MARPFSTFLQRFPSASSFPHLSPFMPFFYHSFISISSTSHLSGDPAGDVANTHLRSLTISPERLKNQTCQVVIGRV